MDNHKDTQINGTNGTKKRSGSEMTSLLEVLKDRKVVDKKQGVCEIEYVYLNTESGNIDMTVESEKDLLVKIKGIINNREKLVYELVKYYIASSTGVTEEKITEYSKGLLVLDDKVNNEFFDILKKIKLVNLKNKDNIEQKGIEFTKSVGNLLLENGNLWDLLVLIGVSATFSSNTIVNIVDRLIAGFKATKKSRYALVMMVNILSRYMVELSTEDTIKLIQLVFKHEKYGKVKIVIDYLLSLPINMVSVYKEIEKQLSDQEVMNILSYIQRKLVKFTDILYVWSNIKEVNTLPLKSLLNWFHILLNARYNYIIENNPDFLKCKNTINILNNTMKMYNQTKTFISSCQYLTNDTNPENSDYSVCVYTF